MTLILRLNDIDPETKVFRKDVLWAHLSGMSYLAPAEPRFALLSTVARLIFVIPHSNTSEERVFSLINKNKTSFRPILVLDRTLSSIVQVKLVAPDHSPTTEGSAHQSQKSNLGTQ